MSSFPARSFNLLRAGLFCALAGAPLAHAQDAASLRARHAELREALDGSSFQRPLYLESAEQSGDVKGDIYARIDQPYATASVALQGLDHWCDILILHLNVKRCASTAAAGDALSLSIGRKFDQPLADTYLFEFQYAEADRPDYLKVVLTAAAGPLSTSSYRIVLEVAALNAGQSFLHLSYGYTQGFAARMATQLYLATLGRSKVGFSVVGHKTDGQPVYIGSTRGVLERNAMRCYLAVEAYLDALSAPPSERQERRLNGWYAGVERYPLQLHEIALDDYLAMKRLEIQRQQAPGPVTAAK